MKMRQRIPAVLAMASLVTCAISGITVTDPHGPPCKGEETQGADGGKKTSDPINLSTGDFQHLQTDMVIPGRGLDFEIKRLYRSFGGIQTLDASFSDALPRASIQNDDFINDDLEKISPIGSNWGLNYNMRLTVSDPRYADGSGTLAPVVVSGVIPGNFTDVGDFEELYFELPPTGDIHILTQTGRFDSFERYFPSATDDVVSSSNPGLYSNELYQWQIVYTSGTNSIQVIDSDMVTYHFNPGYEVSIVSGDAHVDIAPYAGRLQSITDRNGNRIQFFYETTTNGFDRLDYAIDTLGHQIDFLYHDEQFNSQSSPISGSQTIDVRESLIWVIEDHAERAFQYNYSFGSGFPILKSVTLPAIEDSNDFPLPSDQERFPEGSERKWEYTYDDDPALYFWWKGRMLESIKSPNGDIVLKNEYMKPGETAGQAEPDFTRNDGRVLRQEYGSTAYNYVVTTTSGSLVVGPYGRPGEDYYVWVNDRRGAITRFMYAGSDGDSIASARHRQLLKKTEYEGLVENPDQSMYQDNSGNWLVYDPINDSGSATTGPKLPDGSLATATYTQEFNANDNWKFDSFEMANDDTVSVTYDTMSDDPRRWGAVLDHTVTSSDLLESITESWQYDFDFGGSGGCGCGSQGFETAYRDGKGYVTYKVYDTDVNVVTGRAKGDLKAIYEDLPTSSTMDPDVTYAQNNAASIDLYDYNDHGQVVQHTHPTKTILDSSGNPIPHNRVDQYVYYSDVNDSENYGRLHEMHVDVNGFDLVTSYVYDAIGNVIKITDPDPDPSSSLDGDVSVFVYNQAAQMVQSQKYDADPDTNPSAVLFAQTDYFYDANGNLVKKEVMDLDGDQQLAGSITTINEYDIHDYLVTSSREAGNFTGLILEEIGGSGRFIAPVSDNTFVTQKWIYDGGKNLIEYQNGEAVNGISVDQIENIIEYEYDARDLMVTEVQGGSSASALIAAYEYDVNGRKIRTIIDPDSTLQSQTTEVAYDAFDRVVTRVDPMQNQYQYEYDENHNLASVKVLGPIDEDTNGPSDNVVLAEVSRTHGVLDLRETQSVEIFDYNYVSGNPNIASAPRITSYVYNEDSSVRTIISPSGSNIPFERNQYYDTASRIEFLEDISGNITQYEYDVDSNITKMMQTDISSLDSSVEILNLLYEYDALDHRVAVVDGFGNRTETKYDSRSNVLQQEDARNNISAYTYDSLSRQLTTSLGNGTVTSAKAYDASSRLVSVIDHNGNETEYEYDGLNRVIKIIMPDSAFYQAEYDVNGNISQYTDARGVIVTLNFDLNNRLTHRGISGTSIAGITAEDYTYDGLGRLRKAQNDFSKITREYDSRSNIVRDLQNIDAASTFPAASDREVAYEFDLANNTTKLSYPGGRNVYRTFDELNRIAGIFNDDLFANSITEFEYSGRRLQRREHGNGTRTDYTYNGIDGVANASGDFGFGRVAGISTTKVSSSTALDEFAFAWDKTQNRTVYDDIGSGMKNRRERSFGYDAANRLVSTDVDFSDSQTDFTSPTNNGITTYTLDGVYNRTDVSGFESNGAPIGSYSQQIGTYASNNQYNLTPREAGGEWTYLYDENGNMILKAQNSIADLTDDFVINNFDVSAFTAAYSNGDPSADFNGDGSVNFFDVSAFMLAYNAVSGNELEHWHYTYDFRNQLVGISERLGSNVVSTVTSTYDSAARRVIESADADGDGTDDTARQLIYGCASLWEVIEQIDIGTDTTIMTHVYGLGIDDEISYQYEDQNVLRDIWTHRDDLNSLTSITDSSGDVKERYEYGDYGKVAFFDEAGVSLPSSSFNAQHLYTGRSMIAGTGLYDYRFRVMEPETGVFNQRDPLGYVDSMNMYGYVRSNSFKYSDPLGLEAEEGWSTMNDHVRDDGMGVDNYWTNEPGFIFNKQVRQSDPYSWMIDTKQVTRIEVGIAGKNTSDEMDDGKLFDLTFTKDKFTPATFRNYDMFEELKNNNGGPGGLVGKGCISKKTFSGDCFIDCGIYYKLGKYKFTQTLPGVIISDSLGRYACDTSIAEGMIDKSAFCK